MVTTIEEMGIPFVEDSGDLPTLRYNNNYEQVGNPDHLLC